jgi:transcriptional regulator
MYIPKHFEQKDTDQLLSFMQQYNFGLLVSVHDNRPLATHLPFVIEQSENELVIYSHLARANDQWKNLEQQEVMVVFSEPHAYISPSLYEHRQNVPTWNFIAVHAYGKIELYHSDRDKLSVLRRQMQSYEPAYIEQFNTLDEQYINGLLKGIVAFKITVTDLQGKEKLSQNKSERDKQTIKQHLSESDDTVKKDIGNRM